MAVLFFGWDGMVGLNPKILPKRMPYIERGLMFAIHGIISHQTNTATGQQVFGSYSNKNAGGPGKPPNGAHFLIDEDASIYQTASILFCTNHVGPILPRCLSKYRAAGNGCSAQDLAAYKTMNKTQQSYWEKAKPLGQHFPSNDDSIGIEVVGLPHPYMPNPKEWEYESPSQPQLKALDWLVTQLLDTFRAYGHNFIEIFAHSEIAAKSRREGIDGADMLRAKGR